MQRRLLSPAVALLAAAIGIADGDASAAQSASPRLAPPAVYDIAPGLGHFTDDVLFGEVWKRTELAPRDRSLVTVSALVATGRSAQIPGHVRRALDNGVLPAEIGELITQLALYTGWPNAISAVAEVKRVFDERKIGPVATSDAAPRVLEPVAEAARADRVNRTVAPTAPALADLTNRVLFGDLWRRPELTARDRSLVTMAALIAIGQPEQLDFHARQAMDHGLSRIEAAEVATHLGFYAGWPRAMSAVPVLERVFADRSAPAVTVAPGVAGAAGELRIVRATDHQPVSGAPANFTGAVTVSGLYRADAPARIGGGTVAFAAGARTAWHTHPLGQTLFIVSGQGWVQREGGQRQTVGAGDVVWIPANLRHWHGATDAQPMVHFAIAEALDGKTVTWQEPVPDGVYRSAR